MAARALAAFANCLCVDANSLLLRLKTPPALADLAAVGIDALLDTPVGAWLSPEVSARYARAVLEGWLQAPASTAVLTRLVEAAVNELSRHKRPVKDELPQALKAALREVVSRPFSPDRRVVLTLIDRGPTRELARQILLEAVLDFARKASAPVAGMARGLGALARMAGDSVKSRSGSLGGLVGAVGGEVERQLEKRAVEFVDAALAGVFAQLADAVADPRRAAEAAELRVALLDGALELTGAQLARELMNADVPGGVELVRAGLQRWLATQAADAQLTQLAQRATQPLTAQPTRALLAELGVLEAVRAAAIEQAAVRLAQVVATDAFAQWLTALLSA
jgi:hypothetical protein